MNSMFGFEAYSPGEVAGRVESIGVAKARLPLLTMVVLGVLAGGFIGLGALYFTLVASDASLGFATSRVLGGLTFSLGLILVVVAGAGSRLGWWGLAGNLLPVTLGNIVGGSEMAALVSHLVYRRHSPEGSATG
ncbi:MAG: formate/nitrite transporter family protein [Acidobacteria bacterium]|nr:formate/nitrite transporter family protein [Acidobacteriota bacterium]